MVNVPSLGAPHIAGVDVILVFERFLVAETSTEERDVAAARLASVMRPRDQPLHSSGEHIAGGQAWSANVAWPTAARRDVGVGSRVTVQPAADPLQGHHS